MAFVGRMRSVSKLLRSQALSNANRSVAQRALLSPAFTDSELTRNFASAAEKKEVKIKAPLALFGGSGRYATALYLAAVKSNALDKVESELLDFVEASRRSTDFSQFSQDPTVAMKVRVKALEDICTHAKFADITKNFLVLLAESGRLRNVEKIAERFLDLTMEHKGVVRATVTTVIPLPAEEEKELKETLQFIIGQGKKVTLEQKIDTSILGGIVVEFSQKVFDMSIRTRARQMERFLRDPVNIGNL